MAACFFMPLRSLFTVLCVSAMLWVVPAAAQKLLAEEAPESAEPPEQVIVPSVDGPTDDEIADRIVDIFAEIEAFKSVTVESAAGVVTLAGSAPTSDDIDRAETIAARVAGVVTVENQIERDLAVDSNVTPALVAFREDLRGLANALPLIGVAIAIAIFIGLLGYWIAAP